MADLNKEGFETSSVDTEELSEKELKFGYWFVTHKATIRKWTIIGLIVFSVLTYGYAAFALGRYYIFRDQAQQQAANTAAIDFVNVQSSHQSEIIQDVQVLSRDVFPLSDGRVNIVARIKNPNTKWALNSFSYQFALGSQVYETREEFLLPGQEKFLMALNVEGPRSGTPQVLIDDRKWLRVISYEDWSPGFLNIEVEDTQYLSPRAGEISDQLPVSQVDAMLRNSTAYNFVEVDVQIGLFSGSRLVAVSRIPLPNFTSGQVRPVSTRFTQSLSAVSRIEIIPSVNILDQSVYKDFEGEFDPAFIEVDDRGRRL
jgi:hypothetical protein